MSDRNDRTSGAVMHPDDECRPESITQSNLEAMRKLPPPFAVGQEVWVKAVVKQMRPERDGFIDLDVHDYYYVSDDALDASDVEEIYIRVPANHVRSATG